MNRRPVNDKTNEQVDAVSMESTGSAQSVTPVSGFQRIWRSFKLFTRIIVYVPLTILVLIALLIGTEMGSRLSVGLANQFVPDLELTYTSGALNKELNLAHAVWSMDGIKVQLEALHLAWQPTCLLQKQLCISALTAAKVEVQINSEQLASNPAAASDIETIDDTESQLTLPFGIILDTAQLMAVKVQVDEMHFTANSIETTATWLTEGLTIKQLNSEGLSILIPLDDGSNTATKTTTNTTKVNSPPNPKDVTTAVRVNDAISNTNSTSTTSNAPLNPSIDSVDWPLAQLPQVFMPFPVMVEQLNLENTTLEIGARKDIFSHAELQGSFQQYQLTLAHLLIEHTDGKAEVSGTLNLENDYPLSLDINVTLHQLAELPELTRQELVLKLSDSLGQLRINAHAKGDADFILDGQITLKDPTLPYKAKLEQARLQWPLKTAEYFVSNLSIDTQGSLNKQDAKVQGQLVTPFNKMLAIETLLHHQDSKLTIDRLNAKGDIGSVELQGELDYQQAISWKAKVQLDAIKLQEISLPQTESADASNLPNSLISGKLHTIGKLDNNRWQVALTETTLEGTLQGYPFDITGDISVNDAFYVSSKGLNANVLGATLALKGEANANWDLQGELQVPDFGLWLPKASGQLQANINVTGDAKHPQLEVTAQLVDLLYQNIKLRESTLKAYYKPLEQHEFALSLKSKALHLGGQVLDTITLGSKGDINTQKLTLNVSGDLGLDLSVASQFDKKKSHLQAQINRLNLVTPLGLWQLDKDVSIGWDQNKSQGNITPFCLVNPNSRLCLNNQTVLGETGDAQLSYSGNPGKLLAPILPGNVNWDGNAALFANFAWAKGRKPIADLTLNFAPGSILLKRAKNREVTLNYQLLTLNTTLDAKRLISSVNFESEGVASWHSEVIVNVTPDRILSGYANIKQLNLQPLGEFFPQLNTIEGLLTSKLNFAGTLQDPEVSGNITLTQGALALTANPTLIDKIDMSMDLGGQQAELKGRWMMGNGLGRVSGNLRWPQGQFSGELAIQGDKLAVIQPPLAILDISPDLSLSFSSEQLEVKGIVNIPSGNIKIIQLAEGGVALSEDVVFNDSIAAAQPKSSPYAIVADLNINVGNDLRVDGMGLKGKLQGTLKLQQQAFRPPLLFGDIKVRQGSYKFMGQTLSIRTGEVQFVGPASVPNLNIEAIREIKSEDLVAGVRVTGTPARPVVTLFSNPAKEQAEILSYIIKGTGFNSTDNEQNNSLMMGAALGLSSQVGGGAINSIGNTATGLIEEFGFSNVQLDTNDEGRVAISGYIGKNLMVKYGVGVFNPGYEMTVRYYLLSQLYLETVSGTLGQSLDIYYNFNIK
ncbi:translocation/assembly module TamB domain-containing protein [Shewanella profunda]|uniref:autotransporter assembly complex protein TamB n=1 Tax=Shewanella profunda TaxID=254793 RepID=UPI00200FF892|nr:translocation/assembly module TamB domain-containing protein [Shewanella profunda]MCL1089459.1 translocation/assembly module TamB domain-containing protein [Shewanella profunda]